MIKRNVLFALLLSAAFAAPSFAADTAAKTERKNEQQERMKDCNAAAKDKALKGDERKTFMSSCLKGETALGKPSDAQAAQRQKMKTCNADAKTKALKGEERKKFMSDCLKGG